MKDNLTLIKFIKNYILKISSFWVTSVLRFLRLLKELRNCIFLMHYSCVVIILFKMGLYKSVLSIYFFGELVFCLSVLFVFSTCFKSDVIFINFCNICIVIIYIAGVRYSVFLFPFITSDLNNLWEQIHITKIWLQLLIKNMPPESFWVLKISFIKKNVKHLQNEWMSVKEILSANNFFWGNLRSRSFILNLWF